MTLTLLNFEAYTSNTINDILHFDHEHIVKSQTTNVIAICAYSSRNSVITYCEHLPLFIDRAFVTLSMLFIYEAHLS